MARIDAMQHKISYLAKSNPDKLPERVKTRFLAGDKNPFAQHMRHLDPGPLARLPASVAPLLFLPNPPPLNPPEQGQIPSPLRWLKLASTCLPAAQTTPHSRASSPAGPPRTTNLALTPHVTVSTTTGTATSTLGPPPQNLLVRWRAGLRLLDTTAALGPIALGPVHPAGPNHRTPAVGAPPDPPAGIRCAP